MIKRRPLTKDEKIIYQKVLNKNDELLRRLKVRLREIDHILTEGLYLNYLEKREEMEAKKRDICQNITSCEIEIGTASDFIKNGVPIKNKNKEEK